MQNWVVQYVYATEKGENGVSIVHIAAEDEAAAKEIAQQKAMAEEYIFTIHPQSDEQFLGSVKHQANLLVGNGEVMDSEGE
ncbi:hypothetical protein RYZ26_11930 [Terasakiella sp. A23]|uniref:hypothetical protein n=1 Tax=Terasakiella sp. FCG-A23 TaxID=3080561 RepID=UPI002953AC8D|nr:hypothetical protein [Terasakiella sp. A23]MDV7340307.1 hypothetical protein [Terasakiella sp. A23]